MSFLLYLSNYMIPFVFFLVVGYGLLQKVNVYEAFVKGAKEGLSVVVDIMPTLVALMVGVGILRASGTFDYIAEWLGPFFELLHFPSELVALVVTKMFSSSAATGLLLDIFKQYGVDSYLGRLAALLLSSSETIAFTMSTYFAATKIVGKGQVQDTRWTLRGCLAATLASAVASVIIVGFM